MPSKCPASPSKRETDGFEGFHDLDAGVANLGWRAICGPVLAN
jgi:hypothetical protein